MNEEKSIAEIEKETAKLQREAAQKRKEAQQWKLLAAGIAVAAVMLDMHRGYSWRRR